MSDLGRYRKLYARLWRHSGFTSLTTLEKTIVFYLLTGPQTNRLGLYVLSISTAAEDLGTLPKSFAKGLRRVCETLSWQFDSKARVLYIPSWFKWNPPENANVVKGSLKDLNEIPPCDLVDAFARNIETIPVTLREGFIEGLRKGLPNGLPNGMPNQYQYQYQYQDQDQKQDEDARSALSRSETEKTPTNSDGAQSASPPRRDDLARRRYGAMRFGA
jgi:hypothetical protein